jgi:gluconolactonase
LYVTNADERNLRAYDLDHNGDASGERVLVDKIVGIPGGLKVTEKGELYVATTKAIEIYTPEGKSVHTIPVNGRASNCALDPTGAWLYVTAGSYLYRIRIDGKAGN